MDPVVPADLSSIVAIALAAICLVQLVRWFRSWPLNGVARKCYAFFALSGGAMVAALLYALHDGGWGLGITVFVISLAVTPLVFTVGVIAYVMRSSRERPDGVLLMGVALLAAVLTYALN